MTFTRLTRPEGKGPLILKGDQAVVVFDAHEKTVVRTTAGTENITFVVTEGASHVVDQLSASGITFIAVTRRSDNRSLFINVGQIVGVYERTGVTIIRTTAIGEYAEYPVSESVDSIEVMLAANDSQRPASTSTVNALLRKQ
ncbi:hypothetical protein [Mesorhizobium sp. CN2-181]|uniref:hypothetical protein n=1 Tax=Mesorhizobium yinganensis TaxID=3157707 RepID=UPI0032B84027